MCSLNKTDTKVSLLNHEICGWVLTDEATGNCLVSPGCFSLIDTQITPSTLAGPVISTGPVISLIPSINAAGIRPLGDSSSAVQQTAVQISTHGYLRISDPKTRQTFFNKSRFVTLLGKFG